MLVVTRFAVEASDEPAFLVRAQAAVAALSTRPGFVRARLARSADDPTAWLLTTEWAGAGAWRRALGGLDVKLAATPLLAQAINEPSAYEVLYAAEAGAEPTSARPLRAPDAGSAAPGQSLDDLG